MSKGNNRLKLLCTLLGHFLTCFIYLPKAYQVFGIKIYLYKIGERWGQQQLFESVKTTPVWSLIHQFIWPEMLGFDHT